MNFQSEKLLIQDYYDALETTCIDDFPRLLNRYTTPDWVWRGYHPFNELQGADSVAQTFWQPFLSAMKSVQRREDIFFAGRNHVDDFQSTWVVSMGHLVGLFDQDFLGIVATHKVAFFRYAEFNRIENGKIAETAFFFDLPHLMMQAGMQPFTEQPGAQLVQPGPIDHNGLCFTDDDSCEGEKTLALINAMIQDLGQWDSPLPLEQELARTWHDDMIWWGPTGIGATYTIARYAMQHSAPFRAAFKDRSSTGHLCRLAEGHFGGFFGWPNFTAKLRADYLGVSPQNIKEDIRGEFRVIDIYRRSGDKLAENWVFIDIPHWLKQHGVDLLKI